MKQITTALILSFFLSVPGASATEGVPAEPATAAVATTPPVPAVDSAQALPAAEIALAVATTGPARTAGATGAAPANWTVLTAPSTPAVLVTTAAPATAAPTELAMGIELVQKGAYLEAAALLRKAVNSYPEDAKAAYYLGVALNRSDGGKEAEALLKRALWESPEDPDINYELALHYYGKEVTAEAADYFEQVIELAPGSYHAGQASSYLKIILERNREKRWGISVLAGLQYDSNVILNGTGMPLPAGYSGQGDLSGLLYLKGSYTPIKTEKLELSTGYSLYQSLHETLNEFNITQNVFDVSATYHVTPGLKAKGSYLFEYMLLGGMPYDTAHTLAPSISSTHDKWGTSSADYHYRNTSYRNSAKFSNNTDRDGANHMFGLSHLLPVSQALVAWGIYSHDVDLTEVKAWSYQGDRGVLGCRSLLLFGVTGHLSGEVYSKRYRDEDPSYGVRRRDTQYSVSLSLTKNLSERYSLTFGETLTRNVSNIEVFDYKRAITSLLVNARF